MKRAIFVILLTVVLVLLESISSAQAEEGNHTKLLEQTPIIDGGGVFADSAYGTNAPTQYMYLGATAAENFTLTSETTIATIQLMGTYFNATSYTDKFTVIWHHDFSWDFPGSSMHGPGSSIATETNVPSERSLVTGSSTLYIITLQLNTPQTLGPGMYWIEIFNNGISGTNLFSWQYGNADTYGLGQTGIATANGITSKVDGSDVHPPGSSWTLDNSRNLSLVLYKPDLYHFEQFNMYPELSVAGHSVNLGIQVTDLGGDLQCDTINFGDGSPIQNTTYSGGSTCEAPLYFYTDPGIYPVTFTGSGSGGPWSYTTTHEVVAASPGYITYTPNPVPAGGTATFTAPAGYDHYMWIIASNPDQSCFASGYQSSMDQVVSAQFGSSGSYEVCLLMGMMSNPTHTFVDHAWIEVVPSIHVENIELKAKVGKTGYTYTALVTVHTWDDQPVNKAGVGATWTFGDTSGPSMLATTGRNGVATFRGVKDGPSATICVAGITKAGYVFDGVKPCKSYP